MAGEDEKGGKKPRANGGAPRKLDRRDVLKGLSTVPALGLFGYAWQKQREVPADEAGGSRRSARGAAGPAGDQRGAARRGRAGPGADRRDAAHSRACASGPCATSGTEYNQKRVVNSLKRFKHELNAYEDYREMLDKEKELDAVIIATPDFWHAQHAIDCLKAGKHVYCEKEMSNTLEGARSMVLAARETGKLLQIGHQRRSNPRYLHCYNKLITEAKLLGRIVTVYGQWNRARDARSRRPRSLRDSRRRG